MSKPKRFERLSFSACVETATDQLRRRLAGDASQPLGCAELELRLNLNPTATPSSVISLSGFPPGEAEWHGMIQVEMELDPGLDPYHAVSSSTLSESCLCFSQGAEDQAVLNTTTEKALFAPPVAAG
jgi:hypothetical protein